MHAGTHICMHVCCLKLCLTVLFVVEVITLVVILQRALQEPEAVWSCQCQRAPRLVCILSCLFHVFSSALWVCVCVHVCAQLSPKFLYDACVCLCSCLGVCIGCGCFGCVWRLVSHCQECPPLLVNHFYVLFVLCIALLAVVK